MSDRSNINTTVEIGKEAARLWNLSIERGDQGDANAIVALVHAQRFVTFTATVERKNGSEPIMEDFDFSVVDCANPYHNNDGSKDVRKMAARTAALALRLFGISELSNAIKTRLARCIKSAVYLINSLASLGDDELLESVRVQAGKLVIPYGLVSDEPKEDASAKEKLAYAKLADMPISLDGKDGMSLAQLGKRANPPKANRAAGEQKDKGASFGASIDFVTAVVRQWNQPDAETDSAPNRELEQKLFALSQEIAAYFVANPVAEDELRSEEPEAAAA